MARRPVLRDGWVDEAEVVVTADQPLGIWHLQGVALAPVVRALLAGQALDEVMGNQPQEQRMMLRRWLAGQGYA